MVYNSCQWVYNIVKSMRVKITIFYNNNNDFYWYGGETSCTQSSPKEVGYRRITIEKRVVYKIYNGMHIVSSKNTNNGPKYKEFSSITKISTPLNVIVFSLIL